MTKRKVLFSWLGNGDINNTRNGSLNGALAQAIELIHPHKIYLLNGQNYTKVGWKEKTEAYLLELKQAVGEKTLEIKRVENLNPIDYQDICRHLIPFLDKHYSKEDETYFLQTSGTPSTAVVWILLSQTRNRAQLIQTSEERGAEHIKLPFKVFADFIPPEQDSIIAALGSERILYDDIRMKELMKQVDRVAIHDVPVLLLGESGTGKELLAERIHRICGRKGKFVPINCGAIPSNLMESQLFGHEKGAFTGADHKYDGVFIQADKGTLFLDEVGELTQEMQVRLLRVLQEKKVLPVGGSKEEEIDVRIVAATHRNLMQDVAEGRFREDLFYRLAVGVIKIPPLRERGRDCLLLAESFLKQINTHYGKIDHYKSKALSNTAKDLISSSIWPGNVRELENALKRACIWNDEPELSAEHIEQAIIKIPQKYDPADILSRPIYENFSLKEILDEVEVHYLQRALSMTGHNLSKAAQFLGITRETVRKKIKEHKL